LSEFNLYSVENVFEITAVYFTMLKIILICVYRQTKQTVDFCTFLENLEITLNKIRRRTFEYIVMCGDFNIDFLGESNEKVLSINIINSFNLDITVKVPTRKTFK